MENTALVVGIISSVTTGVGFVVGTFSEFFKHRLTIKRDREARVAEQREARVLRQNQFRRETLLALQAASESMINAALENERSWNMYLRTRGPEIEHSFRPLSDRVDDPVAHPSSETFRAAERADALATTLHVRVRDKNVKLAWLHFRFACVAISGSQQDRDHLAKLRKIVVTEFGALQDSVGKVLATLDVLDESA